MSSLAKILRSAKKICIPSKRETKKIQKLVKEIKNKFDKKELLNKKIKIALGGSVAKGTWLPKLSDIDFFVKFDYEVYAQRSAEISELANKILKKIWNTTKLKGSRDYFLVKYKGLELEFVPVLEIKKAEEAKNLTDFSPLHVEFVKKHSSKIKNEIRLLKQFMKSNNVYGAESYIGGFSGHVADLLIIYYGSFEKVLRAAAKWPDQVVIDLSNQYKSKEEIFKTLDQNKLQSPLILIDPIDKNRNAAAALSYEKFNKFRDSAKEFIEKPSLKFFKIKKFAFSDLKKLAKSRPLIIFSCKKPLGKEDVVGAKLKKLFEILRSNFEKEDFKIVEANWQINSKILFWYIFENEVLPKEKKHIGPPLNIKSEHIESFKRKWKKTLVENNRLVVLLKRKYIKPEDLAKELAKRYGLKLITHR
ncbi:MAG: CCA tRNA nucleotidyltransferase [Candidatus Nanoarchaeia archaeon]